MGKGMGSRGMGLPEREKGSPAEFNLQRIRMLFSIFNRGRVDGAPGAHATPASSPNGLLVPEPAAVLLATPRRQKLLDHIWQRTSLSRSQFAALYLRPVERYAELVQQLPASESHHHAYPGGMLDHGLEIVAYALKLRQSHLLPAGATPEAQAAQAEAWTAATAYAALLHDIGKIAVDLHVVLADGRLWHPWHGPIRRPYRFRYRKDREYRLHSAATGLVYSQLLDRTIFDWLSGFPELWAALLYVLAGQYEHAGTLGDLVVRADQASVAQELGGDPSKAMAAPKHALQRKLLDGLRYLLREELKLNQAQASDGWLTQDALWLVSKTVSDKLRAHLLSQGIEGIPSSNSAVFNVLQDHGIALPTAEGKAIWTASIVSEAGWSHRFTFLKISPALIWEASERPAPFAGSVHVTHETEESVLQAPAPQTSPLGAAPPSGLLIAPTDASIEASGLLDLLDLTPSNSESPFPAEPVLSEQDAAPPTPAPVPAHPVLTRQPQHETAPSGEDFMAWLTQGIRTRKLIINDARALAHTVADTVYLVSPGVFQRYAQEHPRVMAITRQQKLEAWEWVQKRFEKLSLHRKQASGLNIWTCEVTGPRKSKQLHGYLLSNPRALFDDLPPNNPFLQLVVRGNTKQTMEKSI